MKPIIIVILLFFSCRLMAQDKTTDLVYAIYQAKNEPELFNTVEDINSLQKDSLLAKIKALRESQKADIIKSKFIFHYYCID